MWEYKIKMFLIKCKEEKLSLEFHLSGNKKLIKIEFGVL